MKKALFAVCLVACGIQCAFSIAADPKRAARGFVSSRAALRTSRVAETRRAAVYTTESEFLGESPTAPHHNALLHSDSHGYHPNCRCDDFEYTAGLWAGYCQARKPNWYSTWLFGGFFGRGSNCHDGCNECSSGK